MMRYFEEPVKFIRPVFSVQDMVKFIEKGEKYLIDEKDSEFDEIDYLQGIILSPDYQRNYKSTLKEESSIIESLLIGIPIPEVFLIRTQNRLQMRHVMDGQHRLNAIYRFVKNKFSLKGLELRPEYNGIRFLDLNIEDKIKILGSHLSTLEFYSFPNPEEEIELFKRYNTNTRKLETQEIDLVTYFSESNKYITNFINGLIENRNDESSQNSLLYSIYNITPSRTSKQKNHQEIAVLLNIIELGLLDIRNASEISKDFLMRKASLYKNNEEEQLEWLISEFNKFNEFILKVSSEIEYPFSTKLLREDETRVIKFSIGLAIIYATLWHYYDIDLQSPTLLEDIISFFKLTPIGSADYNGSTTNLNMIEHYLFSKNQLKLNEFKSFSLKNP
ncbi:DUF262 domain-containing protein [Anaerobacillus alkaliphilus]|nr:DUF262 domain-containing protein [Anaerobacillus alkaliphilus]